MDLPKIVAREITDGRTHLLSCSYFTALVSDIGSSSSSTVVAVLLASSFGNGVDIFRIDSPQTERRRRKVQVNLCKNRTNWVVRVI